MSVVSVCQTITFESLDVGSSFAHPVYFQGYGSSSYMKVIESRSRLQDEKVEDNFAGNVY